MNKKTFSAKPRAASKAPLSPRGKAPKKQAAENCQLNPYPSEEGERIPAPVVLALEPSDEPRSASTPFEEEICGGPGGVDCATRSIHEGSEALRRIVEDIRSGDNAKMKAALDVDGQNRDLATALSVFESPYFMERGWYGGEKMPTFEAAWEVFDPAWGELLHELPERFPDFAGKIEGVRLTFEEYAHACDIRDLHLVEEPSAKARELARAHAEYKEAERRVVCLFADMAFSKPTELDEREEEFKKLLDEVEEMQKRSTIGVTTCVERILKKQPGKFANAERLAKGKSGLGTIRTYLTRLKNHGTIKQPSSGKRAKKQAKARKLRAK